MATNCVQSLVHQLVGNWPTADYYFYVVLLEDNITRQLELLDTTVQDSTFYYCTVVGLLEQQYS